MLQNARCVAARCSEIFHPRQLTVFSLDGNATTGRHTQPIPLYPRCCPVNTVIWQQCNTNVTENSRINHFGTMSNDPDDLSAEAINATDPFELPIDMRFNEGHLVSIVTYSVLMAVSIVGNVTVLVLILRKRSSNRSRINTMLIHLAIADLMVTLLMMPLEIGWAATVSWRAGDAMCRIMAFFRIFGIYLSSFILICISVDRYYAVLRPLHLMDVAQRGKVMLIGAWSAAVLFSAPQMVIFHVEVHPNHTWYEQCITYNVFPTNGHELIYFLFGMVMMYCFPLAVIIYTYSSILLEIYRRSRESGNDRIRRSSLGFLGRAKIRTLKMTIIIVVVFFVCWTPYYIMSVWYWIDRESAKKVDQRIQKGLFLFACTNSCMNPIVYGAFNIRRNTQTPGRAPTIETRVTPVSLSLKVGSSDYRPGLRHVTICGLDESDPEKSSEKAV